MRQVVLLFLLFCIAACSDRKALEIGFIGGTSGAGADLGVAGRNGAILAVEQQNADGGVAGRHVDLVVRDTGQDPAAACKALADLVGRGIEVIVGPMTSSTAMVLVPEVNATGTILISPTVNTSQLSLKDDNFLRVISDTSSCAAAGARHLREKRGARTVAAIYDTRNSAYAESWLRDFRVELERLGGRIVKVKSFNSGNEDGFRKMSGEMVAAKADFVVIVSNALDAARICQQLRIINPRQAILTAEWAATERFPELAGRAGEGVIVGQFIKRNDSSPRYLNFVRSYRERFGHEPGFAGVAGYDAARVAMEAYAIRKPGQSVKEAIIARSTFQGVQQLLHIDRFGDSNRPSYTAEIRAGAYLPVE